MDAQLEEKQKQSEVNLCIKCKVHMEQINEKEYKCIVCKGITSYSDEKL